MTRAIQAWTLASIALIVTAREAAGQTVAVMGESPYGYYNPYSANGQYGMAFGVPSYGIPRTYSVYSSPYGGGYGYGYAPYTYASNRYGVNLWRPGVAAPGYLYESSFYRTVPPFRPTFSTPAPPVGYYAPGFGPPAFSVW